MCSKVREGLTMSKLVEISIYFGGLTLPDGAAGGRGGGPWPVQFYKFGFHTSLDFTHKFNLVCFGSSWIGLGKFDNDNEYRDEMKLRIAFETK